MNTIFKIPNSEEGRLFIALAKKYLNKNDYNLKVRGRTPNRKKTKEPFRYSVPLKYSKNLGVYLVCKDGNKREIIGQTTMIRNRRLEEQSYSNYSKTKKLEDSINVLNELNCYLTYTINVVKEVVK